MPDNADKPLISIQNLKTYYPVKKGLFGKTGAYLKAVDDVSLDVFPGETLGLVGESGCGKSTLGRSIIRLENPVSGHVYYKGNDLASCSMKEMKPFRSDLQIIFQDPYSSLNPREKVGRILGEPLIVHHRVTDRKEEREEIDRVLELVGLPENAKDRYPNEFSGGQRQRIGIARALILRPKFVVCDEPVSALDVSIQAQIMNLMIDLQKELGLTYLFIAHGLGVVHYISNRIAVMFRGKIVEMASKNDLMDHPLHPYTSVLLDSYPVPDPELRDRRRSIDTNTVTDSDRPVNGCCFCDRCGHAFEKCRQSEPQLRGENHKVACFLYEGNAEEKRRE